MNKQLIFIAAAILGLGIFTGTSAIVIILIILEIMFHSKILGFILLSFSAWVLYEQAKTAPIRWW